MYAAECDEKDDQTRGVTMKAKSAMHPLISIGSLTNNGKDQGSSNGIDQDHDHVIYFGHGVTPKDVRGPQPSKVNLMTEIREKNQQINSLTSRVDALESNHQKKIKEMKTAHEVQMAEMKESHQQGMAKVEDAHHNNMATVGDKLELLTKLVLHQRPHEMQSSES
ncbi:hypothetical protein Cgig2_009766 [Carnegiea gigantea]|uniref:Uncharacterized protein n=1 Tax=Carnegiea gigantea TaxID=171969 RepID=A0A9Q1JXI3_9CARY|nr:hypothetical protein Cgig2_009766 [Carnegiea gigantea]